MNISGVRPSESFYSYNSVKINELRNQQIAAAKQQAQARQQESQTEEEANIREDVAAQQTYTSYDYAQSYNPNEVYELKGIDSDITALDMDKVISNLDKDKVLQQYQFFVGSELSPTLKETVQQENVENALRSGENFYL